MITRLQALNFRSLRCVDQRLRAFQALVGPNASGKTTFLDVIALASDLMKSRGDIIDVVQKRSSDFTQLLWMGKGSYFEIAIEAKIPIAIHEQINDDKKRFTHVRYELRIGINKASNEIGIDHETLWLLEPQKYEMPLFRDIFPRVSMSAETLVEPQRKDRKTALKKKPGGNDNYYTEGKSSYMPSFKLGRGRSALANVPADKKSFPVSTWFRDYLEEGVQELVLNSQVIRRPSPPGVGLSFLPDGSNLPWVISELRENKKHFEKWISHVRTALPNISTISTVERPEDRHRYLEVHYTSGAVVPSWLVSDGTLRLLALTIPAYLTEVSGVFLIEEPENGIHPIAVETILQSLASMYESQVLVATHSPIALNLLDPQDLLCFAVNNSGATDVVSGDQHPALKEWKEGQPDLGTLFAANVLS